MQSLRYAGLALVLGASSVWASENFFWMMPPPGITVPDFILSVIAYAIACAVASACGELDRDRGIAGGVSGRGGHGLYGGRGVIRPRRCRCGSMGCF